MCSGGFAKCLGICLVPLAVGCMLCNILLFFPGGTSVDSEQITDEVFYFGGLLGSGVLMIFPALVFLGLKNNDCCGCCGNESCGRRFAMLSSILFAGVGVLGAGYSVIVSAVAINHGPKCLALINGTIEWGYPFTDGNCTDYLSGQTCWSQCIEPKDVVSWHLGLFAALLTMGLIQGVLCAVQVVNGLLGALCGDCCGRLLLGVVSVSHYVGSLHCNAMLSVIFRKNTFTARKVWHCASLPQRSWISALTRASDGGSRFLQPCWALSARSRSKESAAGLANDHTPAILGLVRTEPFQRTQTHAIACLERTQYFHTSAVRLKKRKQPEPPPRELDLLRYNMKDLKKTPKPALILGLAGLLPFVSPPLLMAMTETYFPELAYAQVAYGAAIVSFLGGARWGFALPESSPAKPDWINLANSVVPSLFACVAMLLSDSITSAAMLVIMGLGISLHYDLSLLPTYPSWFKALRAVLTIVAFLSLLGTIIMDGAFPEKMLFSD
ncbi:transmembrane 4 L6 family member 4 [Diretmus argenteus]